MQSTKSLNRREVLLGVIALVGGSTTLASCSKEAVDAVELHAGEARFFGADKMRLLNRIVDTMIPETDTPGALLAGVAIFIDGMMATWAAEDTQQRLIAILQSIDDRAVEQYGSSLADCDNDQQLELIRKIDASAYGDAPLVDGFRELKYLILAGYYTSEIGATVELQYERVPGRYRECVPLEEIGRAWAHS